MDTKFQLHYQLSHTLRTTGHTVSSPPDTQRLKNKLLHNTRTRVSQYTAQGHQFVQECNSYTLTGEHQ